MEQIRTAAVLHRATRHNHPRHYGVHPGMPMLYLVASIGARPGQDGQAESWLRLSEQNLRIDKWSVCQG